MADNQPWYITAFGADYAARYSHRNDEQAAAEVAWLAKRVRFGGAKVLDLACGTGRHSRALARLGALVVGLDLSDALLAIAKEKERTGGSAGSINYVRGNMRQLPFDDGDFDVVLSMFTSFGYFETDEENALVAIEALRVLKPGGKFVLDYLNLPYVLERLEAESRYEMDGKRVVEKRRYDPSHKRLEKRIIVESEPEQLESLRAYEPDELVALMEKTGFKVLERAGAFEGEPGESPVTGPRVILVCSAG